MQHTIDPFTRVQVNAPRCVTRQQIMSFPFPYKLWLVVNLDFCDFLRWNRDGTVILLDMAALESYLNSTVSIFKIKNCSVFLQHLHDHNFKCLNVIPEMGEDQLLQYKNVNFQRHRLDLLAKVRRHTYQLLAEIESNKSGKSTKAIQSGKSTKAIQSGKSAKAIQSNYSVPDDPCFQSFGGLSNVQKSRIRLQTILEFQIGTDLLKQKLDAFSKTTITMPQCRYKSVRDSLAEQLGLESSIDLPMDMYENPHDSVMYKTDFRHEYAGYYGNYSTELIMNFFGEFLPKYDLSVFAITNTVAKICKPNRISTNCSQYYVQPGDGNLKRNFRSAKSMSILSMSSTFEPIFNTTEEEVIAAVAAIAETNYNSKLKVPDINDIEIDLSFHGVFNQYFSALNVLYEYSPH